MIQVSDTPNHCCEPEASQRGNKRHIYIYTRGQTKMTKQNPSVKGRLTGEPQPSATTTTTTITTRLPYRRQWDNAVLYRVAAATRVSKEAHNIHDRVVPLTPPHATTIVNHYNSSSTAHRVQQPNPVYAALIHRAHSTFDVTTYGCRTRQPPPPPMFDAALHE